LRRRRRFSTWPDVNSEEEEDTWTGREEEDVAANKISSEEAMSPPDLGTGTGNVIRRRRAKCIINNYNETIATPAP
jgi:hypothetical protein